MNIKQEKSLEECLAFGSVHVAAIKGFLFKAAFRGPNVDFVSVESDRGLPHLFLLVLAAVSDNAEIKRLADDEYRYPLTISSSCDLERSLRHEYMEIFTCSEDGPVVVRLRSVSGRDAIPGLFLRQGSGASILDAIADALAVAHPTRLVSTVMSE